MFWLHSVVKEKKQEVEKKAPKPQQRRDSPFVGLTEKVKTKKRNKRDTGESSTGEYSSDLHSLSHTQLPSVKLPRPT